MTSVKLNVNVEESMTFLIDKIIKKIYPNNSGTKYICIDELGKVFVYSPVNETVLTLYDELPSDFNRAIWDGENPNIFIGINKLPTISILILST